MGLGGIAGRKPATSQCPSDPTNHLRVAHKDHDGSSHGGTSHPRRLRAVANRGYLGSGPSWNALRLSGPIHELPRRKLSEKGSKRRFDRAFCPRRTAKKGFLAPFCLLVRFWFELYGPFSDGFRKLSEKGLEWGLKPPFCRPPVAK